MILAHAKDNAPPWHQWYKSAFREGFDKLGIEFGTTPANRVEPDNFEDDHIIFGPNYWHQVFMDAGNLITANRCFFGKVEDWLCLGWGGFNGAADYPLATGYTDRFEKWKHLIPEPHWKGGGGYALIVGEYPSACCDKGSIEQFYKNAVKQAVDRDLVPVFRPHPHMPKPDWLNCKEDKRAKIVDADMVYTHSSTFGVHAKIIGAPVVSQMESVNSILDHDPNATLYDWLVQLCNTQWHIDEIRSGEFWEELSSARS